MSLRGFATINYWADDVAAAATWYSTFLGVQPYFQRPGPDGRPAYVEFRIGDQQAELGIVDRRFAPSGAATGPGGAPGDSDHRGPAPSDRCSPDLSDRMNRRRRRISPPTCCR